MLIPQERRDQIEEVTMDFSNNMFAINTKAFPNVAIVIDSFHIIKRCIEAVEELRIKAKREAQRLNKRFRPAMLTYGETVIELLTRSKYLLSVSGEKWTDRQKTRAKILFMTFPNIKEAYTLI